MGGDRAWQGEQIQFHLTDQTAKLRDSFEQLEEAHNKLEKARLDTIFRLLVAAEYTDEDTADHGYRLPRDQDNQ